MIPWELFEKSGVLYLFPGGMRKLPARVLIIRMRLSKLIIFNGLNGHNRVRSK
jgi:hypothetical protein